MRDEDKTKEQLISELEELRQRLTETALLETECRQPDEALWQSEGKHPVLAESLLNTVYRFVPLLQRELNLSGFARKPIGLRCICH
jgi:hypothetical protein